MSPDLETINDKSMWVYKHSITPQVIKIISPEKSILKSLKLTFLRYNPKKILLSWQHISSSIKDVFSKPTDVFEKQKSESVLIVPFRLIVENYR